MKILNVTAATTFRRICDNYDEGKVNTTSIGKGVAVVVTATVFVVIVVVIATAADID